MKDKDNTDVATSMYEIKTNKFTDKHYIQFFVKNIPTKARLPSLAPYRRMDGTFLIEVRRMSNGDIHLCEGMFCDHKFATVAFNRLLKQCTRYDYDEDTDLDGFNFMWDGDWWVDVERDEEDDQLTVVCGVVSEDIDTHERELGKVIVSLREVRNIIERVNKQWESK